MEPVAPLSHMRSFRPEILRGRLPSRRPVRIIAEPSLRLNDEQDAAGTTLLPSALPGPEPHTRARLRISSSGAASPSLSLLLFTLALTLFTLIHSQQWPPLLLPT